jgi:bifunctional UDP-N-acetylglucosamine pyrophosphorylase / glucosamine-1-phosphate N-acetyltransferase
MQPFKPYNTKIIILAAGQGKRMGGDIPKVLVPFQGRPMIDCVLDAVYASNATRKPIVIVGYQAERVREHIGDRAEYVIQTEQLGTGHAVACAENALPSDTTDVLILYGDQPAISSTMINNLIDRQASGNQVMTLATCTVPSFDGWYEVFFSSFSRIIRDEAGIIIRSVEFKDATEEEKEIKELNPCYLICNKEWLFDALKHISNKNAQGEYYLTDTIKMAADKRLIESIAIDPKEALGINTKEQLDILEKRV